VLTAALGGTSSQIENAAEKRMARRRQVLAKISLDKIIKTMRDTGRPSIPAFCAIRFDPEAA